jgi:hypothetical protein
MNWGADYGERLRETIRKEKERNEGVPAPGGGTSNSMAGLNQDEEFEQKITKFTKNGFLPPAAAGNKFLLRVLRVFA